MPLDSTPRLAMWTYPWDVLDLGLETVARDLRERAGLNGINLATAYHAGRFFQPRSPKRIETSLARVPWVAEGMV